MCRWVIIGDIGHYMHNQTPHTGFYIEYTLDYLDLDWIWIYFIGHIYFYKKFYIAVLVSFYTHLYTLWIYLLVIKALVTQDILRILSS